MSFIIKRCRDDKHTAEICTPSQLKGMKYNIWTVIFSDFFDEAKIKEIWEKIKDNPEVELECHIEIF